MKSPETKLSDEQNYNWSQGNFILNQQLFHLPDSVLAPNPNFITQRKAIDHFDNKKRETIAPIQQALWNNAHVKQTAQLQSILKNSTSSKEIIQKKENNTGLPNNLKSGIESLSGYSMDDVKVHYNSSKPKQLEAHAYAQGTDIHLASGQEKHLAHEAWHVVQQKQGRVKPSFQMKQSQINDDSGLEHEAYLMGNRAMPIHLGKNMVESPIHQVHRSELSGKVVQRVRTKQKNPQKKHPSEQGTEVLVNKAELDIIKIQRFLSRYIETQSMSFRVRKKGQRIEVDTSKSKTLRSQLDSRKKGKQKQYIDPSYHETVQYINVEYNEFYSDAEHDLNPQEIRVAYDMLLSKQQASRSTTGIETSGPSPLTTMTPELLHLYHDSHYKEHLKTEDETASTRAYEAAYLHHASQRLPFSQWRPFVLPEQSSKDETSMVNSIGGTLDVQVPTSGLTIGQGKVYSAIYKHFQRAMEILNHQLDEESGKHSNEQQGAFEERTKLHIKFLEGSFLQGLYQNEKENFDPSGGFAHWKDLAQTIDTLVILISASLDNVPDNPDEDFKILIILDELKGNEAAFVKQFELIGTIIGLMIKKEKRQLLNCQMFGTDKQVKECLENLYQLARVESEINKQIPKSKHNIGQLLRKDQERKAVGKELQDLMY